MKPKLILCLALVLIGGLFGCSTMPSGVLSDSAEGKLLTKDEIICLKSDKPSKPWDLQWALTESDWETSPEHGIFVTVHERLHDGFEPDFTAAIYESVGDKHKLLKRFNSFDETNMLDSYFLEPNLVWVEEKAGDRVLLIRITQILYGTGHFTTERVFTPIYDSSTPNNVKLAEVEFVPAGESFQFGKNEGLWKTEFNKFADGKLSFEFFIEKPGDPNAGASGGRVTGTYKLERKPDGGLRIIMDTFKREPAESGS